jgi:hypothetical protein
VEELAALQRRITEQAGLHRQEAEERMERAGSMLLEEHRENLAQQAEHNDERVAILKEQLAALAQARWARERARESHRAIGREREGERGRERGREEERERGRARVRARESESE